jgi:hypothetical protein
LVSERSGTFATSRSFAPSTPIRWMDESSLPARASPLRNAISRPSGDQSAASAGPTILRASPPTIGTR